MRFNMFPQFLAVLGKVISPGLHSPSRVTNYWPIFPAYPMFFRVSGQSMESNGKDFLNVSFYQIHSLHMCRELCFMFCFTQVYKYAVIYILLFLNRTIDSNALCLFSFLSRVYKFISVVEVLYALKLFLDGSISSTSLEAIKNWLSLLLLKETLSTKMKVFWTTSDSTSCDEMDGLKGTMRYFQSKDEFRFIFG